MIRQVKSAWLRLHRPFLLFSFSLLFVTFMGTKKIEPAKTPPPKTRFTAFSQGIPTILKTQEETTPVETNTTLRLMTFNIRHGKGLDNKIKLTRIAKEIQKANADIIALQEVDRFQIRSGFQDQVKVLSQKLGMYSAFSPSIYLGFGEYGNAILSRYPLLEVTVRHLPGKMEKRSLLLVRLKVNRQPVVIAATHLGLTSEEHQQQPPFILHILKRYTDPVILMGDFNMENTNPPLHNLLNQFPPVYLQHPAPTVLGGKTIDHILTNLPIKKERAWTQQTNASDHHPVVAEIVF